MQTRPHRPFRLLVALLVAALAPTGAPTALDAWASGSVCDARGVAVQKDGKVIVVAHARPGYGTSIEVHRFSTRGQPDQSFGSGSRSVLNIGEQIVDARIALDGRQRPVVFVRHESGRHFSIVRLTRSGLLDDDFGDHGRVDAAMPLSVADFAVDSQRRILVTGGSIASGDVDVLVRRFRESGEFDEDFGDVAIDLGGVESGLAIEIDRSDRVLVASSIGASNDLAVVRLTDTGNLDLSWGVGGLAVLSTPGDGPIFDMALSARGEPTVTTYSRDHGQSWVAAGLSRVGQPRFDFGDSGIVVVDGSRSGDASSVVIDKKSRVIVVGYIGGAAAAVRLLANGAMDSRFGIGGFVWFPDRPPASDYLETWYSASLARTGRIVLAGTTERPGSRIGMVAVLLPNGRPNPRFGDGGLVRMGE
ncbi:MAG: hypothetical protein HMLKMBBP_02530 [Planctomycetes bacterium]|nr:hypothetical protein [Planctomycetota bacterium]